MALRTAKAWVKRMRVLVVEDDPLIGLLLAELLQDMGHEVSDVAATEAGAVAAASRDRPELMIVDAHLGCGSGVAAVTRILQAGWLPHLFISGSAMESAGSGAVTLRKPFLEHDLVQAMGRALAQIPVA